MLLLMFYENYMITVTLYVLWFLHSIKYHNQVDRYEIFMSQKRLTQTILGDTHIYSRFSRLLKVISMIFILIDWCLIYITCPLYQT
jgi:hypothetical protein